MVEHGPEQSGDLIITQLGDSSVSELWICHWKASHFLGKEAIKGEKAGEDFHPLNGPLESDQMKVISVSFWIISFYCGHLSDVWTSCINVTERCSNPCERWVCEDGFKPHQGEHGSDVFPGLTLICQSGSRETFNRSYWMMPRKTDACITCAPAAAEMNTTRTTTQTGSQNVIYIKYVSHSCNVFTDKWMCDSLRRSKEIKTGKKQKSISISSADSIRLLPLTIFLTCTFSPSFFSLIKT